MTSEQDDRPSERPQTPLADDAFRLVMASLPPGPTKQLYTSWLKCRHSRTIPAAEFADPERMPKDVVRHVGIMDVEHDPFRFYIRLSGPAVAEATGVNFTGKYVDELSGVGAALGRFKWCADNAKPYYFSGDVTWAPVDIKNYSVLALPFGDEADRVSKIALMFQFGRAPD